MPLPDSIRNSEMLRRPLLAASRILFSLLKIGPALLRRAVYDAMPVPYLVTGHPEHFVVATADKVIGRELFLHGEFDFAKLQTALAIIEREGLPRPQHLIDVGANIGTIVIPALARGLMQSATAIEPHPTNLRLLRANLALNGLSERVRVLAQAVGAESGASLFLTESSSNSGNHSIGRTGLPIPSSRLDDVECPRDGALLWMDIEGYEGHALRGAPNLLAAGIPVVCEFNPSFLTKSKGLIFFEDALKGRRIFDLSEMNDGKEIAIKDVLLKISDKNCFTDILAI